MTPQSESERMAQLEARGLAIRMQAEALFFELNRAIAMQTPPSRRWWDALHSIAIDGEEFMHEVRMIAAELGETSS